MTSCCARETLFARDHSLPAREHSIPNISKKTAWLPSATPSRSSQFTKAAYRRATFLISLVPIHTFSLLSMSISSKLIW